MKPGRTDATPSHLIDLLATCLDLAQVAYPKTYNSHQIKPTEGISLVPAFRGESWQEHNALFFEHEGNRAVRQGKWKLVSEYPANKWQLYNLEVDRSELHDLSASHPQQVQELTVLYDKWAAHAKVIPFEKLSKAGEL